MRPSVAAAATLVLLLLAGCTGGDGGTPTTTAPATCPPGQKMVGGVADGGTGQPPICRPLTPPSVAVGDVPASIRVYRAVTLTWSIDPGDHTQEAHSMRTSLHVSPAPVPDADLAGPDSYGAELAKKEHQNLPAAGAVNHAFTVAGTYYLRAYAQVRSAGVNDTDYWSPEVTITVADIEPTGNNTVVTHPVGNAAGKLEPATVDLGLGDGIVLKNDDLNDHVFTPQQGCVQFTAAITVPSQSSSEPLVFKAPGTCRFTTGDVQPQTLTVNVSADA
jgi:hypothetical protein